MHKVLYFSRGLGFGHSSRDWIIAKELCKRYPSLYMKFVSYDKGAQYLIKQGANLLNLGLEANVSPDVKWQRFGKALYDEQPDLIISDEEFVVIPFSKMFQIPMAFITNFIPNKNERAYHVLQSVEEIIFPGVKGMFAVEPDLEKKINYTGPILSVEKADQRKVKNSSGIRILLTAGGRVEESREVIGQVIKVFRSLPFPTKRLNVLAGELKEELEAVISDKDINLSDYSLSPAVDYLSSDIVITRGGFTTLWELALLGVSSISIPFDESVNRYSNLYAEKMQDLGTTTVIREKDLTEVVLKKRIIRLMQDDTFRGQMSQKGTAFNRLNGVNNAVESISNLMNRGDS